MGNAGISLGVSPLEREMLSVLSPCFVLLKEETFFQGSSDYKEASDSLGPIFLISWPSATHDFKKMQIWEKFCSNLGDLWLTWCNSVYFS